MYFFEMQAGRARVRQAENSISMQGMGRFGIRREAICDEEEG